MINLIVTPSRLLIILLAALCYTLSGCASHQTSYTKDPKKNKLNIQLIHIYHTYKIIVPVDGVFEVRSAEIRKQAYPELIILSQRLRKFMPVCMTVRGYTDSLGNYADDLQLTENQARSLTAFFWRQGIGHMYFDPAGMGKAEAYTIASNRSVEGAVMNRRIEISFISLK